MEVSPSESTVGLIPNTDSISQSQQSVVVQQPMQTTPIPQDKQMLQPVQAQMPSTESQKASGFFSLLKHIFDVLLLKTGSRISRGEFGLAILMLAILPIIGSLVDSGSILESFVSIVGSFAFIRMIILCVKRGHDLNMSGGWAIFPILTIGCIYVLLGGLNIIILATPIIFWGGGFDAVGSVWKLVSIVAIGAALLGIVGIILILLYTLKKGTIGVNKYGLDPLPNQSRFSNKSYRILGICFVGINSICGMTQHFDPFRIIKEVMDDPQVKEAFEMASYDPYAISYTNSILVETNIVNKDIEKVKKQTLNSRYPGCNENDITLGEYSIAACNVGADKSGTGVNSYGDFFSSNEIQGSCASGYHIPSESEWIGVVSNYLLLKNRPYMARNGYYREYETDFQQFQNDFKLPAAGYLDEYDEKVFKMMEGYMGIYHDSQHQKFNFDNNHIQYGDRSIGLKYPIRCFKNTNDPTSYIYSEKERILFLPTVAKIAYPGCTTNDFVIGKYAIAGCNVGSNEAGTGVNSYGTYLTFNEAQESCANGYRVPNIMEWERILFNIPIPTLLLPNAGGENCTTASNCASEMFGLYRTSLPSSTPYNRDGAYFLKLENGTIPVEYGALQPRENNVLRDQHRYSVRCIRDATEEEEHTFFTSKINHTPTIDPKPLIAEEACNVRTLYLRDKNIEEDRLDAIKAELRNNPDATFDDIGEQANGWRKGSAFSFFPEFKCTDTETVQSFSPELMTTYILVIKERQDKEPSIVEVKLTNKEAQIKISDNIGVYREGAVIQINGTSRKSIKDRHYEAGDTFSTPLTESDLQKITKGEGIDVMVYVSDLARNETQFHDILRIENISILSGTEQTIPSSENSMIKEVTRQDDEEIARYLGCDTNDIIIGKYTISACEAGSSYAKKDGKSYTWDEAQTICTGEYYLPSKSDWEALLVPYKESSKFGSLKTDLLFSESGRRSGYRSSTLENVYPFMINFKRGMLRGETTNRNDSRLVRCFKN